jgi:UDP-glucose:(heptosyl)LPS alpha-1,3-glucosyltransferase
MTSDRAKQRALRLALGIFRLQPAGGLERHALRIAGVLAERGHDVTLYTTQCTDSAPTGVKLSLLPNDGRTNHGSMDAFGKRFAEVGTDAELRIGFQRLPGLDVLFCADWCYLDRDHPKWAPLLPRYRTLTRLERACFDPSSKTKIITLSAPQLAAYVRAHGTQADRTVVLPPTIDPAHRATEPTDAAKRTAARHHFDLPERAVVWLWIGLQPMVKGLDRTLEALAKHPDAMLLICGTDRTNRKTASLLAAAERAGSGSRIRVVGMASDAQLKAAFAAADFLVHPARLDVTATVILEAMANGLPVVTTANCGFAPHVDAANAGLVVPVPFEQRVFETALTHAANAPRETWSRHAITYCANPRLYSGIEHACNLIEAGGNDEDWRRAAQAAEAGLSAPKP